MQLSSAVRSAYAYNEHKSTWAQIMYTICLQIKGVVTMAKI